MVEIKEFKPIVYNIEKLKKLKIDFKDIVCPPYDIINNEMYKKLLKKKYNFVNLELPKGTDKTKYKNAKKIFSLWKRINIFRKEEIPSIYIYEHKFFYPENSQRQYTRYGIFCIVKADKECKEIIPHEQTKPKPLEERKKLISVLDVQTSPIFFIVEDDNKQLYNKVRQLSLSKYLFLEFKDEKNETHRIYRLIGSLNDVKWIKNFISKKKLFIADGHHRYKVTAEYILNKNKSYLFGYICSIEEDGLLILPTHRALAGKYLIENVKKYFDIKEWDGKKPPKMLLYCDGRFSVLELKEKMNIPKILLNIPYVILEETIFKNLPKEQIFYHQEIKEAINFADKYNGCAFILPPISKQEFVSVLKNRLLFPPKTTYFYPKVLSGLFVYELEE